MFASDLSLSSQTECDDHACLYDVALVLSVVTFKYGLYASSIDYHNYCVYKLVHLEQTVSAISDIFTNKGVKTLNPLFSN